MSSFIHSVSDQLEVKVVKRLVKPNPGPGVGGSRSLHSRTGEDSNKEGEKEEDLNTSQGPALKHHINDELFSDYKAPVVAKKSKPALENLSSAEVTVSVLSQEEFLENLSKNFLKILAEGLQFNSSSIFSNNFVVVFRNIVKIIIACNQFKLVDWVETDLSIEDITDLLDLQILVLNKLTN